MRQGCFNCFIYWFTGLLKRKRQPRVSAGTAQYLSNKKAWLSCRNITFDPACTAPLPIHNGSRDEVSNSLRNSCRILRKDRPVWILFVQDRLHLAIWPTPRTTSTGPEFDIKCRNLNIILDRPSSWIYLGSQDDYRILRGHVLLCHMQNTGAVADRL